MLEHASYFITSPVKFKGSYFYFVQHCYLDNDCCHRIKVNITRPYASTTTKHSSP